ncbi:unnamed protein product [Prorocentrum cordatum]|uniref:Uncharacterized protein n=1 Tax=Prorocentrum cordatum TaxID=2364126 RepID=A0ABN9RPZ1_9DINO|nr:unnamed protein product [Polarella glacialis]
MLEGTSVDEEYVGIRLWLMWSINSKSTTFASLSTFALLPIMPTTPRVCALWLKNFQRNSKCQAFLKLFFIFTFRKGVNELSMCRLTGFPSLASSFPSLDDIVQSPRATLKAKSGNARKTTIHLHP